MQMHALSAYRKDRSRIHQVFAFASPANQAMTGPVTRFERMILGKSYRPMVDCDHWLIGQAVERERLASVLVTTIDPHERVNVYRFYLSRQSEIHPDCWMTDRVARLLTSDLHDGPAHEDTDDVTVASAASI